VDVWENGELLRRYNFAIGRSWSESLADRVVFDPYSKIGVSFVQDELPETKLSRRRSLAGCAKPGCDWGVGVKSARSLSLLASTPASWLDVERGDRRSADCHGEGDGSTRRTVFGMESMGFSIFDCDFRRSWGLDVFRRSRGDTMGRCEAKKPELLSYLSLRTRGEVGEERLGEERFVEERFALGSGSRYMAAVKVC
jgi:hypothetical protein